VIFDRDILTFDATSFTQPLRNAAKGAAKAAADARWRNPITGTVGCCARAASGHATAAPPSA